MFKINIAACLLLALSFFSGCSCATPDKVESRVIAIKKTPSHFITSTDLVIDVIVKNMGPQPVWNVVINDFTYKSQNFTLVSGTFEKNLDILEPEQEIVHSFVVRSDIVGKFVESSAFVEYMIEKDNEKTRRRVRSMAAGPKVLLSSEEYYHKFASHGFEFAVFLILMVIPVFVPYMQYSKAKAILKK